MSSIVIVFISVSYLSLLFLIAFLAEKHQQTFKKNGKLWAAIYALSVSVYCTAWTFYGSIGMATRSGLEFLTVYLGPAIMAPLWFVFLRKIVRICKLQQITSIADFISSRYGKNLSLGYLVTIFCLIGIIPYIALQLKAISDSFNIITSSVPEVDSFFGFIDFTAVCVMIGLAMFTILFGARKPETTEQHGGLMVAVAFESVVKLVVFLIAGVFLIYWGWESPAATTSNAAQWQQVNQLPAGADWVGLLILSGFAATFLPRQFQVNVVETSQEQNLKHSSWVFPLYLLLINLMVIPIAYMGMQVLGKTNAPSDYLLLTLPLHYHANWLAVLVYIGGISASSSMVMVEATALSTMFSNNLVIPFLARQASKKQEFSNLGSRTLLIRRSGIVLILFLAYLYYETIGHYSTLVSIGFISFVSILQFVPSIIGGIYWQWGNKYGVLSGLIAGFIIWFYTLILPSFAQNGFIDASFITEGPLQISWLKPYALFGLDNLKPVTHAAFYSLSINLFLYVAVSLWTEPDENERNQAEIFTNIFSYSQIYETSVLWKGTAYVPDMEALLANFLGETRAQTLIQNFAKRNKINIGVTQKADPQLVAFVERTLAGIVGTASARIMISAVAKDEEVHLTELMEVLKESQKYIQLNSELKRKTIELRQANDAIEKANRNLQELDDRKNDFLTTVTHELRTPITSIRAFSEILFDNPELELEERQHFLQIITRETDRLSRLISQVLDLEKYESGKQELNLSQFFITDLITEVAQSFQSQLLEKKITLTIEAEAISIMADKDRLQQVLINLLGNAVKFVEQGKGTIHIEAGARAPYWYLSITDNGKGIAPQVQELIFEKFYQAENQTIRKPKGSGLGLAICKKIVELHHGKLSVESAEGKGAKFTLLAPSAWHTSNTHNTISKTHLPQTDY